MKSDEQQKIDIALLKQSFDNIERVITKYETNHFPTIERRFDSLENKIAYWSGGLALLVVVMGLLLKYLPS